MGPPAFYAVAVGRSVGVFRTWPECQRHVEGFNNAKFKKFSSHQEALAFIEANKGTNDRRYRPWSVSTSATSKTTTAISTSSSDLIPSTSKTTPKQIPNSTLLPSASTGSLGKATPLLLAPPKFGGGQKRLLHATFGVPMRNRGFDDSYWTDAEIVYTDGACSNNGKNRASAGWGVYWSDDSPNNLWGIVNGEATNNRGELEAVVQAIQQAKSLNLPKLIVRTDSQLLIQSMDSWIVNWKKNNWKKSDGAQVKNTDLLQKIDELLKEVNVKFEYVAGHAGIEGNEKADALARKGAQMDASMRNTTAGSSGTKASNGSRKGDQIRIPIVHGKMAKVQKNWKKKASTQPPASRQNSVEKRNKNKKKPQS